VFSVHLSVDIESGRGGYSWMMRIVKRVMVCVDKHVRKHADIEL
jgi:hypothetical protein